MAQKPSDNVFIKNAEVDGQPGLDVRCRGGVVVDVGRGLVPAPAEVPLDAEGGALLPGLHDHHIHLPALAAARRSVRCGPPEVRDREALASVLRSTPGEGWIRAVGYHESVAGPLSPQALDEFVRDRPVRVQHRSGKMWFLNSAAIGRLGAKARSGRLFRQDDWLRNRLSDDADFPAALASTGRLLASFGVTGVTETTPTNNQRDVAFYNQLELAVRVNWMGDESLSAGSLKILLDDASLPLFESLRDRIAAAHRRGRPVAVHCVTRTELVFALAALREAGTIVGDRIEHAAVTDRDAMRMLRESPAEPGHLTVVTQPHFIAERGESYLREVPRADHDHLYRCRGFLTAGVPLGGGTDAPFGDADPWAAMAAAVTRQTSAGVVLGVGETLTPEQALNLFLGPLDSPGGPPRRVRAGCPADLCLLDRPWSLARLALRRERVVATLVAGVVVYRRGYNCAEVGETRNPPHGARRVLGSGADAESARPGRPCLAVRARY